MVGSTSKSNTSLERWTLPMLTEEEEEEEEEEDEEGEEEGGEEEEERPARPSAAGAPRHSSVHSGERVNLWAKPGSRP